MDQQTQTFLFMIASSVKNNDNIYSLILPFLIMVFPMVQKMIPIDKLLQRFYNNRPHTYFEYIIPSHDVPVMKTYTQIPIMRKQFSTKFLAVTHYIHKTLKNHNFVSITEIMSYNADLIYNDYNHHNHHNHPNQDHDNMKKYIDLPLNNAKTMISQKDGIYCEYKCMDENNENNKNNDDHNKNRRPQNSQNSQNSHYSIILSIEIQDNYIEILSRFVDNCVTEYEKFVSLSKKKQQDQQYIFSYMNSEKVDSTLELNFNEFVMDHNKDLNVNIFFEQKQSLIQYIKPFVYNPREETNNGEELYKKCGMTFKAGLLFYGEPGCGKTTTIKGILKYTKRNAVIVDLSKVKTCEELETIFRLRKINKKTFSSKELCYILEDCDAFEGDVIKKRDSNSTPTKTNDVATDVMKFMEHISTSTYINPTISNQDTLNLSCILNLLDGIIELNGIMIIMTTNHPEKIDPALIRPGRFDFKCEFRKASKETIKDMLKLKYNKDDEEMHDLHNVKEYVMTPAQIQSICFKHENIQDCINDLIVESQK
jgi:ATP-dependent 26S proteasome regulatory subunit